MKNTYKFTNEDMYSSLEFAKQYQLNPSKSVRIRTNQGKRGFGGVTDAFLIKGFTEIAACKIIMSLCPGKWLFPDFEIHPDSKVAKEKDPDITRVYVTKTKKYRKPEVKVEIKKTEDEHHWFYARQEQIAQDLENNEKGYMVYVSLDFNDKKGKKQRDLTGAVLQKLIPNNRFSLNEFSNFSDLEAKIECSYSYSNLQKHGFFFQHGLIMPKTTFPESYYGPFLTGGKKSKQFELIKSYDGTEEFTMKLQSKSKENHDISLFSDWVVEGKGSIYRKIKTGAEYIYAETPSTMENSNLGKYQLEKDKTYVFHLINVLGEKRGTKVEALRENAEIALSRQKLKNLQDDGTLSLKSVCQEIADEI